MPIYKNNDPAQGKYCVSPAGHIVFHEPSQKVKAGWRECEESDLASFPEHLLVHAGLKAAPPAPPVMLKTPPQTMDVKVQATGTVTDGPPE